MWRRLWLACWYERTAAWMQPGVIARPASTYCSLLCTAWVGLDHPCTAAGAEAGDGPVGGLLVAGLRSLVSMAKPAAMGPARSQVLRSVEAIPAVAGRAASLNRRLWALPWLALGAVAISTLAGYAAPRRRLVPLVVPRPLVPASPLLRAPGRPILVARPPRQGGPYGCSEHGTLVGLADG